MKSIPTGEEASVPNSSQMISPQSVARLSAFLGHDPDEVITTLVEDFEMTPEAATTLVAAEFARRDELDEADDDED
jgi:hypothetical protein